MPSYNEPLVLTYDNLVIGGNLEALFFAYKFNLKLIYTIRTVPFPFENHIQIGNLQNRWNEYCFTLSLSGQIPFGDKAKSITYIDSNTLYVVTTDENKYYIKFKKLWVFQDHEFNNLPPHSYETEKHTIIDHCKIISILKEPLNDIYTGHDFINSIHFFKLKPHSRSEKLKNFYSVSYGTPIQYPEYLTRIRLEQLLGKDIEHCKRFIRQDDLKEYEDFDNVYFCYTKIHQMLKTLTTSMTINYPRYLIGKLKLHGK